MKKITKILLFASLMFGSLVGCKDDTNIGENGATENTTINPNVTGIAIDYSRVKVAYSQGEALDLTCLVVTANYDNNTSGEVKDYKTDPAEGTKLNTLGTVSVGVTYSGFTKSFDVTVSKALTGITLDTDNVKQDYVYGENLDLTGLVVNATYSDGSTNAVSNYRVNPANGTKLKGGANEITVTYGGFSETFTVTVARTLSSITLDTDNVKKEYNSGDALDLTGLVAKANYEDNTSETVTDYTVSPINGTALNTPGENEITVTYKTVTASFKVNVAKAFVDISLNTDNVKKDYAYGEALDLTGLVVNANYNDNSSVAVTDYTVSPANGTILNILGDNDVTVTYKGTTTSFKIVVTKVLTGIDADVESVKKAFKYGEALDLTGLVVTAFYNDNSSEVVTDYTVNPANGSVLDTVGNILVNITYGGQYTNYMISVAKEFTTIEINTDNVKKVYNHHEALDLTGLVVTARYSDGSTEDVTDYTTNPLNGYVLDDVGTKTIAVTYAGKTKTFDVTVNAVLESITLNTTNVKKDYTYNTKLNLNGLKIIGHYSDGTTAEYTDGYTSDPANGTLLTKIYTNTVTISFGGKTASFDIWVSNTYLSLTVDTTNVKKTYQYGEALDLTGIVAIGHYGNGDTKDHTAAASYEPANGTILNEIGSKTIKVSYAGHSTTFSVDVRPNEETGTKVTVDLNRTLNFGQMTSDPDDAIFSAHGSAGTLFSTTMHAKRCSGKADTMTLVNGKTRFYEGDSIYNSGSLGGITKVSVHGGNGYFKLLVGYTADNLYNFLENDPNQNGGGGDRVFENIPNVNYFKIIGSSNTHPADIEYIEVEYTRGADNKIVLGTAKTIDQVNVVDGNYSYATNTIVVNGATATVNGVEYTFAGIEYNDSVLYVNDANEALLIKFVGGTLIEVKDIEHTYNNGVSGTYSKTIPATSVAISVNGTPAVATSATNRVSMDVGETFTVGATCDAVPAETPTISLVDETNSNSDPYAGTYTLKSTITVDEVSWGLGQSELTVAPIVIAKDGNNYVATYSDSPIDGYNGTAGQFAVTVNGNILTFGDEKLTITINTASENIGFSYDDTDDTGYFFDGSDTGYNFDQLMKPSATLNNGVVTAVSGGDFYIKAVTSNNVEAKYYVHVNAYVPATVSVSPNSVSVEEGETIQINAAVNDDATNKALTYTSADNKIAKVSTTGVVTGVKAGTTTITVTTADGNTATVAVTVNASISGTYSFDDDYVPHTIECVEGVKIVFDDAYTFNYNNGVYEYEDDENCTVEIRIEGGKAYLYFNDGSCSFFYYTYIYSYDDGPFELIKQ